MTLVLQGTWSVAPSGGTIGSIQEDWELPTFHTPPYCSVYPLLPFALQWPWPPPLTWTVIFLTFSPYRWLWVQVFFPPSGWLPCSRGVPALHQDLPQQSQQRWGLTYQCDTIMPINNMHTFYTHIFWCRVQHFFFYMKGIAIFSHRPIVYCNSLLFWLCLWQWWGELHLHHLWEGEHCETTSLLLYRRQGLYTHTHYFLT